MSRDGFKKHWRLIEKWKDGADIQYKDSNGSWQSASTPMWRVDAEYRVKPREVRIGSKVRGACTTNATIRTILGEVKVAGVEYWIVSHHTNQDLPAYLMYKNNLLLVGDSSMYSYQLV